MSSTFASFGLDPRLLRAITKLGWAGPTLIQEKAIPLAIQGKDILARARTGSGKTAAYAIPVIQRILTLQSSTTSEQSDAGSATGNDTAGDTVAASSSGNDAQPQRRRPAAARDAKRAASAGSSAGAAPSNGVKALILVPTKELSSQAKQNFRELTHYCSKAISAVDLSGDASQMDAQRLELATHPDIVIGTPSRIVAHLDAGNLDLKSSLQMIVVDEADLVFSFGYESDVRSLLRHLPRIVQAFLMSATLSPDVESLKKLMLHSPVVLKLQESQLPGSDRLVQFIIRCSEDEKFLLVYTFLKLKLLKGKTIIFVNDVDRCYRLKLFLEQFAIKACVLNSELPQNSRFHIVQEFNRGVYDYIIATDEHDKDSFVEDSDDDADVEDDIEAIRGQPAQVVATVEEVHENENGDEEAAAATASSSSLASPSASALAGAADAAPSASAGAPKTHDKSPKGKQPQRKHKHKKGDRENSEYGVARGVDFRDVSNVVNFDFPVTAKSYIHRVGRTARGDKNGQSLSLVSQEDEPLVAAVENKLSAHGTGHILQPFSFAMDEVAAFKYRVEDALRAVTRVSVKEARLKEIKMEILNSEKLKAFFEDNPKDKEVLRHDKTLHPARVQPHLKHVPSYLMPQSLLGRSKPESSGARTRTVQSSNTPATPMDSSDATALEASDLHTAGLSSKAPRTFSRGMKRKKNHDPLKTFSTNTAKRFAQDDS